ncbi:hypothetical protein OHB26_36070 [Nocardia sp. NBC_01503]|uniref:DUF7373 family lipoprotein n=1 Tax=Nocardia sp. NBC_01503 TaxID=2975997 RepID=UPI002E7B659F|nr:hypothetical protein [Nocardia sp. NBC_01503]WTL32238.1 hypothetical protein OHB26_36070 [Nocardia sp. NBC_01503]
MKTFGRRALTAIGALLLTTSCGIAGHPVEAGPAQHLDTGNYDTAPLIEPVTQDGKYGKIIESMRMGEAIIDPVVADPEAKYSLGVGIAVLPTPDYAALRLGAAVRSVLEQERMLAGFWTGGSDTAGSTAQIGRMHRVSVVLLRFPDDATAQRAAAGIDTADAAVSPENVAAPIPGYDAAHSHRRPDVPTLASTLAHGSYVVSLFIQLPSTDLTALTDVAAKAFAAQLPLLDTFAATPADQFASLPLDRDGMLRRTQPNTPGQWPYPVLSSVPEFLGASWDNPIIDSGVILGRNAIHLKYDRTTPGDLTADAFAKVGLGGVLRFADATAARKYISHTPDPTKYRLTEVPAGVPDARCIEDLGTGADTREVKYSCKILVHRYVGFVIGGDLPDLLRKTAAQYLLLIAADTK